MKGKTVIFWKQEQIEYIERVAGKVPPELMATTIKKPLSAVLARAAHLGLCLHIPKGIMQKHWPEYMKGGSLHVRKY